MTTLTLTACGTTKARLEKAGTAIGKVQAGVNLAPWPAWCSETIEHAQLNKTTDVRILLRRERRVTSKLNAKLIVCAEYFKKYAELLTVNQNAKAPSLIIK
ncbi:hypothetical protein [Mesorhizobium sp. M7A.F.Ca.CA.002.12.1.1]|uniref:hypothetical protein n=1 Tax=Mesorhizobium sp. M7A.F.Ca.CA.002.12.1.1 TaxID=2496735 RepID=UPI000FCA0524|nr:hypothetical protein [Mesorhizobium sp. M7A.F.Ca.CA.002.12.1.1]RUX60159.1 hypothetical protein EN989_11115 [Mesorhizobium sp. M7A.F.Ca.CA.002.12.1.1]